MFLKIGPRNLLSKLEKTRANPSKLPILNILLLFGRGICPIGFTEDVVKHFVEDHFVIFQLFVLLLEFDIHLAKWAQPLIDHKSA